MVAPTGSMWYGWGHHFKVIAQTTRDGKPAVRCRYTTNGNRKRTFTVITDKLLKHAERTDERE
jgi:hypothetical protein